MEVIVALIFTYVGAPVGLLCLLLGLIGVLRKKRGWPAVLLGIGAVLTIFGVGMGVALMNTNFGL